MIKASIDIGTNTILLLIANVSGNNVEIIEDHHKIARLGEGLDKSGFISDAAIERGRKILEFYADRMKVHKVESVGVVATSAMRDAKNSSEVRAIFEEIVSAEIRVIAGDEEARLSFLGSIEDDEQNTVIDIGGGSTEIICGNGSNISDKISLQTGAVRLSERSNLFYPFSKESYDFADDELNHLFEKVKDFQFGKIVAVAGTPNTLAQICLGLKDYSRDILHNFKMTSEDLDKVIEIIKSNPQQHLIDNYGVHPNRADIILGGALILRKLLDISQKDSFIVSSNGLRFGVIKS